MIAAGPGKRTITVLIVDDHPLLRAGIAAVVQGESDMKLAGEAATGREAVDAYRALLPDVTIMDLQMPDMDGIAATAKIVAAWPGARIFMLSTYRGDAQALRALEVGAAGYMLKSAVRTDLLDAIRAVHAGHRHIPPEIAAELAMHRVDATLTLRELQVLRCVANGSSNRAAADQLCLSEDTVKSHMKNILSKLGANDRTHAVMIAVKRGIIDAP